MVNFEDINEDCLRNICGLLSLRDQIQFAQVCINFQAAFYLYSMALYKHFNLNCLTTISLSDVRDFFMIAGSAIETINGVNVPCLNIVKLISEFCVNVKVLNLQSMKINDSDILAMVQLENLETLSLAENFQLKGKYLYRLTTLKELNVYACSNMRLDMSTLISLKKLQSFDIRRCKYFKSSFFETMVKYYQDLETLKISIADEHYAKVALLPRLKRLVLNFSSSSKSETLQQQVFRMLVEHKSQHLELLEILGKFNITLESAMYIAQLQQLKQLNFISNDKINDKFLIHLGRLENLECLTFKNCRSITDIGLNYIIRNCQKLQSLNIEGCCNITDNFVWETLKSLRHENELELIVFNTSISTDIVENPKYIEAAEQRVKLIFYRSASAPCEEYSEAVSDFDIGHWTNDEVMQNNNVDVNNNNDS